MAGSQTFGRGRSAFAGTQRGEGELLALVFLAVLGLAGWGAYSLYRDNSGLGGESSPKIIEADGQTYLACKDRVQVTTESSGLLSGPGTFKVTFTDAVGLAHVLRGIKQVQLSDIPRTIPAPMPFNPSLTTADGKPLVEGSIYTWPDGSKARFRNGTLEPTQIPNDACQRGGPDKAGT